MNSGFKLLISRKSHCECSFVKTFVKKLNFLVQLGEMKWNTLKFPNIYKIVKATAVSNLLHGQGLKLQRINDKHVLKPAVRSEESFQSVLVKCFTISIESTHLTLTSQRVSTAQAAKWKTIKAERSIWSKLDINVDSLICRKGSAHELELEVDPKTVEQFADKILGFVTEVSGMPVFFSAWTPSSNRKQKFS